MVTILQMTFSNWFPHIKIIIIKKNHYNFISFPMKIVPKCPITNKPALVQIKTWYQIAIILTHNHCIVLNQGMSYTSRVHCNMWICNRCPAAHLVRTRYGMHLKRSKSGVGVTKPISYVPLLSEFFSIVKTNFSYWISCLYLEGVPQLSCGDTCQIWIWFEKCNMYFCLSV